MKFTTIAATALALATPAFSAECQRFDNGASWEYRVTATGMGDGIPGWCGGLWDNLKHHPACPVGVIAECSRRNDGSLIWDFLVGRGCDGRKVEEAWYSATKNQFGAIYCP